MSMSKSGERKLTWQTADPDQPYGDPVPEAGRALDALVAEKVFGWKRYKGVTWIAPEGHHASEGSWPCYSTSISAAWLVVEKMRDAYSMSCAIATNECAHSQNGAKFYEGYQALGHNIFDNAEHIGFDAIAETVPLAICRAAIEAISPRRASQDR